MAMKWYYELHADIPDPVDQAPGDEVELLDKLFGQRDWSQTKFMLDPQDLVDKGILNFRLIRNGGGSDVYIWEVVDGYIVTVYSPFLR